MDNLEKKCELLQGVCQKYIRLHVETRQALIKARDAIHNDDVPRAAGIIVARLKEIGITDNPMRNEI